MKGENKGQEEKCHKHCVLKEVKLTHGEKMSEKLPLCQGTLIICDRKRNWRRYWQGDTLSTKTESIDNWWNKESKKWD